MFTNSSFTKCAGFTLVEILVVLAIVALLGALLLGVFARVREKGRSATCQSNLQQIALAMQQYVGDNDGRFPAFEYVESKGTPKARAFWWSDMILPYNKSDAILRCPSSNTVEYAGRAGYSYNRFDLNHIIWSPNHDPKTNQMAGWHESKFSDLSGIVLNFDDWAMSVDGSVVDGRQIETSCGLQAVGDLHSGGANFSYGDGHVKWVSPQQQGEWICGVNARQRAANANS